MHVIFNCCIMLTKDENLKPQCMPLDCSLCVSGVTPMANCVPLM